MELSDQELLNGILKGDREMIRNVYRLIYPSVEGIVLSLYGSKDDAHDIFQESLLVIYSKLIENKFELKSSLKTYMCALAKNMTWGILRKRKKNFRIDFNEPSHKIAETLFEDESLSYDLEEEKTRLYEKHFELLQLDCQKLLKYFFLDLHVKQITFLMRFNSDSYTKSRRGKCKEFLMKSIFEDPLYKKLNYEPYSINR